MIGWDVKRVKSFERDCFEGLSKGIQNCSNEDLYKCIGPAFAIYHDGHTRHPPKCIIFENVYIFQGLPYMIFRQIPLYTKQLTLLKLQNVEYI
jgi:hypothetical protein